MVTVLFSIPIHEPYLLRKQQELTGHPLKVLHLCQLKASPFKLSHGEGNAQPAEFSPLPGCRGRLPPHGDCGGAHSLPWEAVGLGGTGHPAWMFLWTQRVPPVLGGIELPAPPEVCGHGPWPRVGNSPEKWPSSHFRLHISHYTSFLRLPEPSTIHWEA